MKKVEPAEKSDVKKVDPAEKPESKLSKSAEKRKRKKSQAGLANGGSPTENGNSPKKSKLTELQSASPKLSQKRKAENGVANQKKKAKNGEKMSPKTKPVVQTPSPKMNGESKKSKKKSKIVQNVEKKVEAVTKSAEVAVEKAPKVEPEKKKNQKKRKREETIPTLVKLPKNAPPNVEIDGSLTEGRHCFEWMISPCKVDLFFGDTFEKRPLHIKRGKPNYYSHLLSTKVFDDMLRDQTVHFGKNLDVTSFTDGKRETHNPEGRAYGPGKNKTF